MHLPLMNDRTLTHLEDQRRQMLAVSDRYDPTPAEREAARQRNLWPEPDLRRTVGDDTFQWLKDKGLLGQPVPGTLQTGFNLSGLLRQKKTVICYQRDKVFEGFALLRRVVAALPPPPRR